MKAALAALATVSFGVAFVAREYETLAPTALAIGCLSGTAMTCCKDKKESKE